MERYYIHSTFNFSYIFNVLQVIVLQSYWRQWLSKRYVSALRRERRARQEWEREREEERRREREQREKTEFQRRMNPKTKEDFELVYHALEGEDTPVDYDVM